MGWEAVLQHMCLSRYGPVNSCEPKLAMARIVLYFVVTSVEEHR